jgi:hypothetical protein
MPERNLLFFAGIGESRPTDMSTSFAQLEEKNRRIDRARSFPASGKTIEHAIFAGNGGLRLNFIFDPRVCDDRNPVDRVLERHGPCCPGPLRAGDPACRWFHLWRVRWNKFLLGVEASAISSSSGSKYLNFGLPSYRLARGSPASAAKRYHWCGISS